MIQVGSKVRAMTPANVRRTPGYRNKEASGPLMDVVSSLRLGEITTVLEGPTQADEIPWYRTEKGWVAAEDPSGEVILSPLSSPPFRISSPVAPDAVITQGWGERPEFYSQVQGYPAPLKGHNGIDWGHFDGAPIYACADGTVVKSETDTTGFGELVKIQHAWGESIYAHLSIRLVNAGQSISAGACIGRMGNTGMSSGTHLHFGIRVNPYDRADGWGGFSNPLEYLE